VHRVQWGEFSVDTTPTVARVQATEE
jgi:hypothetical protein